MSAFFTLLVVVVEIYVVVLVVYAVCSWFPPSPGLTRITRALGAVCEPVLRPLRRLIPPVQAGGAAIDLSIIIVIVVLEVVVLPILKYR